MRLFPTAYLQKSLKVFFKVTVLITIILQYIFAIFLLCFFFLEICLQIQRPFVKNVIDILIVKALTKIWSSMNIAAVLIIQSTQ